MANVSVILLKDGKRVTIQVDEDVLNGLIANLEGGASDTIYLSTQCIDGGGSSGS
jgi:hypothetical protein